MPRAARITGRARRREGPRRSASERGRGYAWQSVGMNDGDLSGPLRSHLDTVPRRVAAHPGTSGWDSHDA